MHGPSQNEKWTRKNNVALTHTIAFSKLLHTQSMLMFPYSPNNAHQSKFKNKLDLDARMHNILLAPTTSAWQQQQPDPPCHDAHNKNVFLDDMVTLTLRNTVHPILPISVPFYATELFNQTIDVLPHALITHVIAPALALPRIPQDVAFHLLLSTSVARYNANHPLPSCDAVREWFATHEDRLLAPEVLAPTLPPILNVAHACTHDKRTKTSSAQNLNCEARMAGRAHVQWTNASPQT
jgi:hypothetical protein